MNESIKTYFETYKLQLEEWLDKNIISYAGKTFNTLFDKQLITTDDIENFYEELNENDFDTKEEYKDALDNQEPQQVGQWLLVTEEAYNKFKTIGHQVVKFEELYFYGRPVYGQMIVMDFYYMVDKIKIILDIE
jgi:hypothetical protein